MDRGDLRRRGFRSGSFRTAEVKSRHGRFRGTPRSGVRRDWNRGRRRVSEKRGTGGLSWALATSGRGRKTKVHECEPVPQRRFFGLSGVFQGVLARAGGMGGHGGRHEALSEGAWSGGSEGPTRTSEHGTMEAWV